MVILLTINVQNLYVWITGVVLTLGLGKEDEKY